MVSVINCRHRLTKLVTAFNRFNHCFAEILQNKIKYRCGTAAGGSPCAGKIIVGRYCPAERHCKVRVRINSTGEYKLSFRIYGFRAAFGFNIFGNSDNLAVLYRNIRLKHFGIRNDRSVFNKQIHKNISFR